ncbi:MAG: hypothetical protein M3O30_16645 [Planctomycetota bacterium]|nr:hypothetical protein [Planctomycetota bacterium]
MYKESGKFLLHIARQKAIWKDGELWTSLAISVGAWWWMDRNNSIIAGIREQFGDILTVSSILVGFVMTTLVFYGEVASGWSKKKKVRNVANKIVDWQVWSVLCLLAQLAYTIFLHIVDGRVNLNLGWRPLWFAILVFLTVYSALQILNHVLIIWWAFRNSSRLEPTEDEIAQASRHNETRPVEPHEIEH